MIQIERCERKTRCQCGCGEYMQKGELRVAEPAFFLRHYSPSFFKISHYVGVLVRYSPELIIEILKAPVDSLPPISPCPV